MNTITVYKFSSMSGNEDRILEYQNKYFYYSPRGLAVCSTTQVCNSIESGLIERVGSYPAQELPEMTTALAGFGVNIPLPRI